MGLASEAVARNYAELRPERYVENADYEGEDGVFCNAVGTDTSPVSFLYGVGISVKPVRYFAVPVHLLSSAASSSTP